MAQARVTEFFAAKKRTFDAQPSKRRKLAVTAPSNETLQAIEINTRATRSSRRGKTVVDPQPVETEEVRSSTPTPKPKSTRKPRAKAQKAKQVKVPKGQTSLKDVFDKSSRPNSPDVENQKEENSAPVEEVTSAWDEHDGPLTPSKRRTEENSTDSENEALSRKRRRRGNSKEKESLSTPNKEAVQNPTPQRRSRKKLVMRANVIQSSDSEEQEVHVCIGLTC